MHFLGSDIRGKPPEELAWDAQAGARIVGSYDAIRWVPDAEVVPPGIDLRRVHAAPRRPTASARSSLHAPSSRRRKGTEHVIAACEQLPGRPEDRRGPAPRRGASAATRTPTSSSTS